MILIIPFQLKRGVADCYRKCLFNRCLSVSSRCHSKVVNTAFFACTDGNGAIFINLCTKFVIRTCIRHIKGKRITVLSIKIICCIQWLVI